MTLPSLSAASSRLVELVTPAQTPVLLSCGSQTSQLAMLVNGVDDPIDTGITSNGFVLWVHQDNLVVLVGRILVDPV